MDRWHGRVALVTGASSGIGAAICRMLSREGMHVIGCARDVERIREMALREKLDSITAIQCDLRQEGEIQSMFEKIQSTFGRLHLCINNAGLSHDESLLSGSTALWKDILDVNVLALCICTREALKLMKESNIDDGQIIHIGSMSGHRIPEQTSYMYVASKCAVVTLAQGLRKELREIGNHTRVACISPGLVETEFEYRCFQDDPAQAKEIYQSIKCMEADDVADAVAFVLRSPPHVDVLDVLMRPYQQDV